MTPVSFSNELGFVPLPSGHNYSATFPLWLGPQAIEQDGNNAAYFSNRAAAYTKLGDYLAAVEDAQRALAIDPTYTKAYSRLA